jgi:ribosome biogenesis GTPase A
MWGFRVPIFGVLGVMFDPGIFYCLSNSRPISNPPRKQVGGALVGPPSPEIGDFRTVLVSQISRVFIYIKTSAAPPTHPTAPHFRRVCLVHCSFAPERPFVSSPLFLAFRRSCAFDGVCVMGKRAFSAKAKREQLRTKRATSSRVASDKGSVGGTQPPPPPSRSGGRPSAAASAASGASHVAPSAGAAGGGGGGGGAAPSRAPRSREPRATRYRLAFAADTEAARAAARAAAFEPLRASAVRCCRGDGSKDRTLDGTTAVSARELAPYDVRPPDMPQSAGPRRPPWRYDEGADVLERRERAAFDAWLRSVARDSLDAAFFEQNLETWRQLWRVIERSDVLVLVADIRYPALHFVPGLYEYVTRDLHKGMVLALNKCDLVSEHLLAAWKDYFEKEFPGLAVALFSSFPDAKLAPEEQANSELLSKRERRMARSTLAAWGADQLLAAIDTLPLPPHKKEYLEQWRARLHGDPSNLDEGDDHEQHDSQAGAGCADHQQHVSPDSYSPPVDKHPQVLVCDDQSDQPISDSIRSDSDGVLEYMADVAGEDDGADEDDLDDDDDDDDVEDDESTPCEADSISTATPSLPYGSDDDDEELGATRKAKDSLVAGRAVYGHEEDGTLEGMVTIGVIGHPNTGKSTLINGVFGRKVVSTSSTPGHTKHLQTMFLSKRVRLCDCPGLVFPGHVPRELQVIAGMYPIAQLREPYSAVKYLAERVPLVSILDLELEVPKLDKENEESFLGKKGWTGWKICEAWAMKRGFRTAKAARLDVYRAANSILRLALDGRVVLATMPPGYAPPPDSVPTPSGSREHATVISASDAMRSDRTVPLEELMAADAMTAEEHDGQEDYDGSDSERQGAGPFLPDRSIAESSVAHNGGMFDILGEA